MASQRLPRAQECVSVIASHCAITRMLQTLTGTHKAKALISPNCPPSWTLTSNLCLWPPSPSSLPAGAHSAGAESSDEVPHGGRAEPCFPGPSHIHLLWWVQRSSVGCLGLPQPSALASSCKPPTSLDRGPSISKEGGLSQTWAVPLHLSALFLLTLPQQPDHKAALPTWGGPVSCRP